MLQYVLYRISSVRHQRRDNRIESDNLDMGDVPVKGPVAGVLALQSPWMIANTPGDRPGAGPSNTSARTGRRNGHFSSNAPKLRRSGLLTSIRRIFPETLVGHFLHKLH